MNAYVYQAAFLCEPCAVTQRAHLDAAFKENDSAPGSPDDDSGRYPQGPYPDGGGKADCPQHCDTCNVFLENPLTADGYDYVAEYVRVAARLRRVPGGGVGLSDVVRGWGDFYGVNS